MHNIPGTPFTETQLAVAKSIVYGQLPWWRRPFVRLLDWAWPWRNSKHAASAEIGPCLACTQAHDYAVVARRPKVASLPAEQRAVLKLYTDADLKIRSGRLYRVRWFDGNVCYDFLCPGCLDDWIKMPDWVEVEET